MLKLKKKITTFKYTQALKSKKRIMVLNGEIK